MRLDTIINRDALCALRELPAESVHCCVTSPPYYALRDYGMDAQIGREDTPEQYLSLIHISPMSFLPGRTPPRPRARRHRLKC